MVTKTFDLDSGLLCLDFSNTVDFYRGAEPVSHPEHSFDAYGDLLEFGLQSRSLAEESANSLLRRAHAEPAVAEGVLARALQLRNAIYEVVVAVEAGRQPPDAAIARIWMEYSASMTHRVLVWKEDDADLAWVGTGDDLSAVLWPVAASAVEMLLDGDIRLVGRCAGQDCDWLFLDKTKNHSRRWCSMSGCGNRAKARRHYSKGRAKPAS